MSNKRSVSKQSTLPPAFLQAAALDPEGALSSLMLSAFGMTLDNLMLMAKQMMETKDASLMLLAFTAGVQIRANVVFVGQTYGDVRRKYPGLIIEGEREQKDIFNFGALHALGHVLAHVSNSTLGSKIIGKAGSCITGEQTTDSEAGKINKEIAGSWTMEDKARWSSWLNTARADYAVVVGEVAASVHTRAAAFNATLAGAGGLPGRTTVVPASSSKKVPAPPAVPI